MAKKTLTLKHLLKKYNAKSKAEVRAALVAEGATDIHYSGKEQKFHFNN